MPNGMQSAKWTRTTTKDKRAKRMKRANEGYGILGAS